MKLGLNDLHPSVGDVLKARVWSVRIGPHRRPEDAGLRRVFRKRWRSWRWRALAAVPIGALIGAGVAAAAWAGGSDMGGAAFAGAYLAAVGSGVGTMLLARLAPNRSVSGDELRALAQGMNLGASETTYLGTVCALLEAGVSVPDDIGHDVLNAANDLLEQARQIGGRLERLRAAASTGSVAELEAEREEIAHRVAEASDPQVQSDLRQSLTMCDERLTNARALAPLIQRLEAQQEVIHQTLLSVQSSVSRLQVAPTAVAAPDVHDVERILGQVTAQTKAVEDAVQEVMALSGQVPP